jgi:hypothetical protein
MTQPEKQRPSRCDRHGPHRTLPEEFIGPMRQELTRLGVQETRQHTRAENNVQ